MSQFFLQQYPPKSTHNRSECELFGSYVSLDCPSPPAPPACSTDARRDPQVSTNCRLLLDLQSNYDDILSNIFLIIRSFFLFLPFHYSFDSYNLILCAGWLIRFRSHSYFSVIFSFVSFFSLEQIRSMVITGASQSILEDVVHGMGVERTKYSDVDKLTSTGRFVTGTP